MEKIDRKYNDAKRPMKIERKDDNGGLSDDQKGVKDALSKISDKVKEVGEKALSEAEKGVKLSASNKEQIDELLLKQGELIQAQKDLDARLAEAEQKSARDHGKGKKLDTIGHQFVDSEGFKSMADARGPAKYHMGFKAVVDINSGTTGTGAAGDLVVPQRVENPMMTPGLRRLTIRQLIGAGRTNSNSIEYVKESGFQNMAAAQGNEGTATQSEKAQSDIAFEDASAPVVTVAHWMRANKQILADAPRLQSYIDGRMRYGLAFKEELMLLMGAGGAGVMEGVYTAATAYANPGVTVVDQTAIDTIRLAILQGEVAEYPVDGVVLNPIDWASIELTKDDVGRYIIGNPQGNVTPTLWGRPVVATQAMTIDKFLVGAFGMGAEVFDREDAAVLVSTEDGDNFRKNKVTILAEERLALAIYRDEAFIKGDFGFVT
jgi:HK97 family phage major capsid protein